jgi:hypothetical protein
LQIRNSHKKIEIFYYKYVRPQELKNKFGTNIPQQGLVTKFGEAVVGNIEELGKFIDITRTDVERTNENLEGTPIGRQGVGEYESGKQRLEQINSKIQSGKQLTYDEIIEKNDLETFVGIKTNVDDVLDKIGTTSGQVAMMASGTNLLGNLLIKGAKGLGILKKVGDYSKALTLEDSFGTAVSEIGLVSEAEIYGGAANAIAFASSYDQAKKQAIELMPESSETKQTAFATAVGLFNVITERMFKDEKILNAIRLEVKADLAQVFKNLTEQEIAKLSKNELFNILKKTPTFLKYYAKNVHEESFEEFTTEALTAGAKALYSPDNFNFKDELDNALNTYADMAIGGVGIGFMGAASDFRKSQITTPLISKIGYDDNLRDDLRNLINSQRIDGKITEKEAVEKHRIVSTIENIHNTTIPLTNKIRPLSKKENDKVAVLTLQERVLKSNLDKKEYAELKPQLEKQIKEIQDQRNKIIEKEVVVNDDYTLSTIEEYNQKLESERASAPQGIGVIETKNPQGESMFTVQNPNGEKEIFFTRDEADARVVELSNPINSTESIPYKDTERVQRRLKNQNLTHAKGSTFFDDVKIQNAKVGDEIHVEKYENGEWKDYNTKVKEIVDGKVIFENGETLDDVSAGINMTAEDAWFDKNHPELSFKQNQNNAPQNTQTTSTESTTTIGQNELPQTEGTVNENVTETKKPISAKLEGKPITIEKTENGYTYTTPKGRVLEVSETEHQENIADKSLELPKQKIEAGVGSTDAIEVPTTTDTPTAETATNEAPTETVTPTPTDEISKQSQEEFARHLQDNYSDKLSQEQIYKLLTVRPELRERMLNESPQEWAKIFEKNPDYRQQANNVDNNKEMRGNANPAWTGISIGETTNKESDGRHKGYVTLDVTSAREMGKNLEQTFKDLYEKLKQAGYNGHLKMPGVYSDLLTRFDNIVIHGATKGDVSLALPIIEQYFKDKGLIVEGTKTGIDAKDASGKETSHTNLLAEKVKNKQLEGISETPVTVTPTPTVAVEPLKDVETQEKRQDIKGYDKFKEVENSGGYIKSNETIIDNDFENDDVEHKRTKAYKVEYSVDWQDLESSSNPDSKSFDAIDDAYDYAQRAGDWVSGNVDHENTIRPIFKEIWLNSDGTEYEETGNKLNGEAFSETEIGSKFIGSIPFGIFGSKADIYNKYFGKRDDNSRELENEVWSNLGADLEGKVEKDGKEYTIRHSGKGKYSDLIIEDADGEEVDRIQLRIADHTYNPRNNDNSAREGKFISVEIANVNATAKKFNTAFSMRFDGTDTYEKVLEDVQERVNEIIDNKIEFPKSTTPTTTPTAEVEPTNEVKSNTTTTPIAETPPALSDVESTAKALEGKLPDAYQANTRNQSTKDLIKWAEDIFDTKFEGDFEKGEYVSWFQSLGKEGYEAASLLNTPKKALLKLKESPTYKAKSESLLSKEQSTSTQSESNPVLGFNIDGKNVFYHASDNKRVGRLKPNNAPQFGTGVYLSTSKKLVEDEFGDKNTTSVKLSISNPVYTNTKEWNEVESLAIEKADKDYGAQKGLKLEEGETFFRYDKDNLSEIAEIPSKFISDTAKELGYDAIIDKGSSQYENEVVVLDNSKIIYEESLLSKEQPKAETPTESKIEKLEKEYNSQSVEDLVTLKKKLYPNPDIESAMSEEEKLLDKVIAKKFSDINQQIIQKRKNKQNETTRIADNNAENELAVAKLTEQDNPIAEPIIEVIEGEAESNDKAKLNEVIAKVDELVNNATDVVNVPISEIKINSEEYQGRKKAFSERSANKVHKFFSRDKFNPIIIYKHPDGNTYVLSGHSRLEGMKRRGESTIPARYFEGNEQYPNTPEGAKKFAMDSNKDATLQTDLENSDYYRGKLKSGSSYNAVLVEAKENEQEGSAVRIIDYAHLNPKGKAYQALEALEKGESDTSTNVKLIAQKVGRIRSQNEHLTDAHEQELFDYFSENGYPTDKEIQDPNGTINRSINAVRFDPKEPLNLNKFVAKTAERIEWEKELKELENLRDELKKEVNPSKQSGWSGLKEKVIASLAKGKSKEQIDQAEKDFNSNKDNVKTNYEKKLAEQKQKLQGVNDKIAKHLLREKSLIQGEKNQGSLFSTSKPKKSITKEAFTALTDMLKKAFPKVKFIGRDEAEKILSGSNEPSYDIVVNGETKTVKPLNADVINGFYSPLEKTINETKFDKLPAKQWIEKFAKGDEAKWTGLAEWLSQQQGSVSKADIQNYLKDNRISIVEVVKGGVKDVVLKVRKIGDKYEVFNAETSKSESAPFENEADARDFIDRNKNATTDATKFGDRPELQLEGEKENYKEVLVTMPQKTEKANYEVVKKGDLYYPTDKVRNIPTSPYPTFEQAKAESDRLNKGAVERTSKDTFKSSHFEEPNILVHLRMNTRTDSEGNKVLFLEEVQSDWGQKGKREGFEKGKEYIQAEWEKADKELDAYNDYLDKKYGENYDTDKLTLDEHHKLSDLATQRARMGMALEKGEIGNTPNAPFVTETPQWTKLALKVALKEAVKQGADKIAWTTGEQQNDRYDLGKQVDSVYSAEYSFLDEKSNSYIDSKDIEIKLSNGSTKRLISSNDGKILDGEYVGEILDNVIGKELAQKVLSVKGDRIFEGVDLKIGGKGMKGFYGSPTEGSLGIVGNVAKSLFKQEPKTVELQNTSTGIASQDKVLRLRDWVQKNKNEDYSYNDAQKDINDNSKLYQEYQKNTPTQHSIDITPELKAQVSEGIPLFMRNSKGEIFGFESNGKIFLDETLMNADTPIHEVVGHYGINIIDAQSRAGDAKATAVILKGFALLKEPEGKAVLDEVKANPAYANLSERKQKLEALATIIGREGAVMFEEGTKDTKQSKTFASKVKAFVNSFYEYLKSKIPTLKDKSIEDIQRMDNKEFIRAIIGDAFRGEIVADNETKNTDDVMLSATKEAEGITLTYNDKGQHLAPNGKPSNLTEQQAKIVRTEAFKSWFGDWENDPENASKVVDRNGEPLVVYHGSPSGDITQFDRNKSKTESSGLKEFGSWFTTNKKVAELYANKRLTDGVSGNAIYPVFLNLRNLPEFDAEGKEWYYARRNIKADVGYKTATGIDAIEALAGKNSAKPDARVDGIKLENVIEGDNIGSIYEGTSYLVFDDTPNQIKLADGTNTTFNPNTNDIRFSIEPNANSPISDTNKRYLDGIIKDIEDGKTTLEEEIKDIQDDLPKKYADKYIKYLNDNYTPKQENKKEKTDNTKTEAKETEVLSEEDNQAGIAHRLTEETRKELGLPEYEKETITDAELDGMADAEIKNGYNIKKLVTKMAKGVLPTALEQTIMKKYLASLEAQIEKNPTNESINDYKTAVEASDAIGSEIGRSLRSRRGGIIKDDSIAAYFLQEMESAQVDELTEAQKNKVQKEYNDIQEVNKKLQEKIAQLEIENAKFKANETVSKESKNKEKKGDLKKQKEDIQESIKQKLKEARGQLNSAPIPYLNEIIAIAPDVAKLVKVYVQEGIIKLDEIVDKIHETIKESSDNITKKDIVDIIAGNYNEKKQTKNEIAKQLVDLRVQANLVNKLESLENGVEPKTEQRKVERNKEISYLRKKINENYLTKLASAKSSIQNQIDKLTDDLKTGNFLNKEENTELKLDKEAIKLKDELIRLKKERDIRILRQNYANRSLKQKVVDGFLEVINVPRTIMSSMDFSAPLRQGLIASISHPAVALNAFKEMFRQAVSQKRFDRWFNDIRESEFFDVMEKSGLYVADPHDLRLSAKEEQFMNNLAEKIPFIGGAVRIPQSVPLIGGKKVGGLIKGSERAYVSYLNKMRVDLFTQGAQVLESMGKTYDNSPKDYEGLASFVNNSTGRGKLGAIESAAPILNSVFFSPRLIASRLNLLNPLYYAQLPSYARKMALKDMTKFVAFGVTILALIKQAWGCPDDCPECTGCANIELDPRSTDFGKIIIGDTRYDTWGGFQQYVRIIAQMMTGEAKSSTTGNVRKIDGEGLFGKDRADVLGSFARGKLAPVPASILDIVSGRNIIGEKVDAKMIAERTLLPLIYSDVKESYKEQGVKALLTVGLPATFGIGVNTYESKPPKNPDFTKEQNNLLELKGIGDKTIPQLQDAGIESEKDLKGMSIDEINEIQYKEGSKKHNVFSYKESISLYNQLNNKSNGKLPIKDLNLTDDEKKSLKSLGYEGISETNVDDAISQVEDLKKRVRYHYENGKKWNRKEKLSDDEKENVLEYDNIISELETQKSNLK